MNKLFILIVAFVMIIGGSYFFINSPLVKNSNNKDVSINKQEKENITKQTITPKKTATEEEKTKNESPEEAIMGNSLTKKTQLKEVTGKSATGIAYILRVDNTLQHYVEATLPKPKDGNEYEGWLVKKNPTLKFFSTGVMTKEADGKYTLLFSVDDFEDFTKDYNFIVITEESIMDEIPETHILEGTI